MAAAATVTIATTIATIYPASSPLYQKTFRVALIERLPYHHGFLLVQQHRMAGRAAGGRHRHWRIHFQDDQEPHDLLQAQEARSSTQLR